MKPKRMKKAGGREIEEGPPVGLSPRGLFGGGKETWKLQPWNHRNKVLHIYGPVTENERKRSQKKTHGGGREGTMGGHFIGPVRKGEVVQPLSMAIKTRGQRPKKHLTGKSTGNQPGIATPQGKHSLISLTTWATRKTRNGSREKLFLSKLSKAQRGKP